MKALNEFKHSNIETAGRTLQSLAEKLNAIEPGAGMHVAEQVGFVEAGQGAVLLTICVIAVSHILMTAFEYLRQNH